MNLSQLLRGIVRCETVTGPTETTTRIPHKDLRSPVSRVHIRYTPVSLKRTSLFPYPRQTELTIWFMRMECRTLDGQRLISNVASDAPLTKALDYAYLKGMQSAIAELTRQLQAA